MNHHANLLTPRGNAVGEISPAATIDAADGGVHHDLPASGSSLGAQPQPGPQQHERPWRHHLLMMAVCLPMLVIVGALVITGVVDAAAIGYAVLCIVMMAAMMMLMRGDRH